MSRPLACALLISTMLGEPAAHAQPSAPPSSAATEQARQKFVEGAALAREGRWREALTRFEESAVLRPHAVATFNVAYCERALGHSTRAWFYFGRALDEDARASGTELTGELRRGAREYADELEQQLARATVTVDHEDAAVAVDGRPLELVSPGARPLLAAGVRREGAPEAPPAATFELVLDAGKHTFLVQVGERTRAFEHEIAAGASPSLSLALGPAASRPSPIAVARSPSRATAPAPDRVPPQRVGAIVLGSLGLASLTAAGVLTGLAAARWDDALGACPARTSCPDDRGQDLSGEARRYGDLATIGWVTAGVAAAGAIVLWVTAPPSQRSATAAQQRGDNTTSALVRW